MPAHSKHFISHAQAKSIFQDLISGNSDSEEGSVQVSDSMQYAGQRLAVVADDLTGACDTACQFALYGFRPLVFHYLDKNDTGEDSFVVVNTDSRKDDARAAYQKVADSLQHLVKTRHLPIYKKMDSTLKGNWEAELAAMVRKAQPELVIVAPAFPAWGRTTVDGVQCCRGRPVDVRMASSAADGPAAAGSSNLVDPLRSQFGQRVYRFGRPALKRGPAPLARQIQTALFRGYSVQVFDANEDEDLKTVVMAGCRLENRVLWTGSAGLARYLPLGWGCSVKAAVQGLRREPGPVLVINGSLNPVNAEQLGALEKYRSAQVFWIEDEDSENSGDTQVKLGNLRRSMETGADAALSVRLTRPIRSAAQLQQLQDTLQFAALQCVKSQTPAGMVLVGGDTAMKLYWRVGAAALRILGEVQPGISYGSWVGGVLDGQYVVTKAGGFGEPGTLVKAVDFLRGK